MYPFTKEECFYRFETINKTDDTNKEGKMKGKCFNLIMLLLSSCVFLWGCSRIEIQKPAKDEVNIATPYTAVVRHTGCGTAVPESFKAWLDKDGDSPLEISDAFSYAQESWTAQDYNFPRGTHTLTARADVTTGASCVEDKSLAKRTFFVAPCADFVQAFGENFQLDPDTLTITYGPTVVTVHQGETAVIRVPEHSPYLVDGKLSATIRYSLRNITQKHMKIQVLLQHGIHLFYGNLLAFCGPDVLTEQYRVLFTASSSPEPLTLMSKINESFGNGDPARFFHARLQIALLPAGEP